MSPKICFGADNGSTDPDVFPGSQIVVSTGIKGSQFHQFDGSRISESLIGGDAVRLYNSFYMNFEGDPNFGSASV
jgi:hypothetical protein